MTCRYLVVGENLEFAKNVAENLTDAGAEMTPMKMPGMSGKAGQA